MNLIRAGHIIARCIQPRSIENDLCAYILADAVIADLIGVRLYPLVLPQPVTYPAASYYLVSVVESRDLSGPAGKERARITINSWAVTYAQAKAVARAMSARVNPQGGLSLTVGATRITSTRKENERDVFEDEAGSVGATGIYGVTQDFIIAHHNV